MLLVNIVRAKEGSGLVVRRYGKVVRHGTNCGTGDISCSEVVRAKPRNAYHFSSGKVASSIDKSSHNAHLVLLGKLTTETNDSLKQINDRFTSTVSLDVNGTLFHSRALVIWSADHHPSPAYDTRCLLQPLGVRFLQHDLSPYCSFFNLCAERHSLKVSYVL